MLTRRIDSRERAFNPIPISYLIQTANQFSCDIYVSDDKARANLKQYDEMKNLRMVLMPPILSHPLPILYPIMCQMMKA